MLMRFKQCSGCMKYSKRFKRCKLKDELITLTNGKCSMFDKIPNSILAREKRQKKNDKKNKEAKQCIGCSHNKEGFCDSFGRFANFARKECQQINDAKQEELRRQQILMSKRS